MKDIKLVKRVRGLKLQSGDVVEYDPDSDMYSYVNEEVDNTKDYRKWTAVSFDFSPAYAEELVKRGSAEFIGEDKVKQDVLDRAESEKEEELPTQAELEDAGYEIDSEATVEDEEAVEQIPVKEPEKEVQAKEEDYPYSSMLDVIWDYQKDLDNAMQTFNKHMDEMSKRLRENIFFGLF